jgi:hypothetical protein
VNLRRITQRAKDVVEKRGGTESLKQDAAELKKIATGQGSVKDKAKAAAGAIKDPGSKGAERTPGPTGGVEGSAPPEAGETRREGSPDERRRRRERGV